VPGDVIGPITGTTRSAGLSADAAAGAGRDASRRAAEFTAALDRHLQRPRAMVAEVRAEIDSIRGGAALDRAVGALAPAPAVPPAAEPVYGAQMSSTVDPFGWRATARQLGDSLIAPGYGTLYERQIQQESGFDPEVAFGFRRSSAGAEGIAQLMPQYYPGVDRTNPRESLVAGARTMRQYLDAWDGDVRKALASYNAGLGRVRSLVDEHGAEWEQGLPAETRTYLDQIVGASAPRVTVAPRAEEFAVFGGVGPGGVLTSPLDPVLGERAHDGLLDLLAAAGTTLRAPSDGRIDVAEQVDGLLRLVLDHGNGWRTTLQAPGNLEPGVALGALARRGEELGTLGAGALAGSGQGVATLGVSLNGVAVDPTRYLLRS
jgi:soluble lytic murein transglycosylase-like protein